MPIRKGAYLFKPRSNHLPPALQDAFDAVHNLLTHVELVRGFLEGGESKGLIGGPHIAMLARRVREGLAKAERAVGAVRDDLNRVQGTEAVYFDPIPAENAHLAAIRFAAFLDNELTGYLLDGSDATRWTADAERLREWFRDMPAANRILAAVELEASRAAATTAIAREVIPETTLACQNTERNGQTEDPATAVQVQNNGASPATDGVSSVEAKIVAFCYQQKGQGGRREDVAHAMGMSRTSLWRLAKKNPAIKAALGMLKRPPGDVPEGYKTVDANGQAGVEAPVEDEEIEE
jgi:hypothetical protein